MPAAAKRPSLRLADARALCRMASVEGEPGASVSAAVNWGANAVVTGSFLWMLERVGAARTWGAYLGACALAYVVVDRTLEETKGKTLESRGEGEGEGD